MVDGCVSCRLSPLRLSHRIESIYVVGWCYDERDVLSSHFLVVSWHEPPLPPPAYNQHFPWLEHRIHDLSRCLAVATRRAGQNESPMENIMTLIIVQLFMKQILDKFLSNELHPIRYNSARTRTRLLLIVLSSMKFYVEQLAFHPHELNWKWKAIRWFYLFCFFFSRLVCWEIIVLLVWLITWNDKENK